MYPFNADPNKYYLARKARDPNWKPTLRQEYEYVAEMAEKDGYIGMLTKWMGSVRAEVWSETRPRLIGEDLPATLNQAEDRLEGLGVIVLGGDAVDNHQGITYPEDHVVKSGAGYALSPAGSTKLYNHWKKGLDTVAIVAYPKLMEAMKRNPIFQRALKDAVIAKLGKTKGNRALATGRAKYRRLVVAARKSGKKIGTTAIQQAATIARVNMMDVAKSIAHEGFEEDLGKIVGVGKLAKIPVLRGKDRTDVHEAYPGEIQFERYVRLPDGGVDFIPFIESLKKTTSKGNPLEKVAYLKIQGLNFTLSPEDSPFVRTLIEIAKASGEIYPTLRGIKDPKAQAKYFDAPKKEIDLHGGFKPTFTPAQVKMVYNALIKPGVMTLKNTPGYVRKLAKRLGINDSNFSERADLYLKGAKKRIKEKPFWQKIWAAAKRLWSSLENYWVTKPIIQYAKDFLKDPKIGLGLKHGGWEEIAKLKTKTNAKIHIKEKELMKQGVLDQKKVDQLRKAILGAKTFKLPEINYDQLKAYDMALYKVLQNLDRPLEIPKKGIVITKETEERIQKLTDHLIKEEELDAVEFEKILEGMDIEHPGFISKDQFITEKQGKDLIKAIIEKLPSIETEIKYRKNVPDFGAIGDYVHKIEKVWDKRHQRSLLADLPASGNYPQLKRPNSMLDMTHYTDKLEEITGKPMGELWNKIWSKIHSVDHKVNKQLDKLSTMPGYDDMFGNEALDIAVEKYISEEDSSGLNGEQKDIIDASQRGFNSTRFDICL